MNRCPLGDFRRSQQGTKYQSFHGTMTVAQAKHHLQEWPPFEGPVELEEAIHRAFYNRMAQDHIALCALMQSGEWRK